MQDDFKPATYFHKEIYIGGRKYVAAPDSEPYPVRLDKFHQHEAIHTVFLANEFVADNIVNHSWIDADPVLKEKAQDICSMLFDLYQALGADDAFEERFDEQSG